MGSIKGDGGGFWGGMEGGNRIYSLVGGKVVEGARTRFLG